GAHHLLAARGVHRLDAAHQPLLDERAFFRAPAHLALLLPAPAGADDQVVGFLVLAARALAERRHAPGRHRVAAALRLALAAAVLQLDVVHHRARRDVLERERVPRPDVRVRARLDLGADLEPRGREDVRLLAVRVVQQRDPGGAVRVVLDRGDLRRDAVLAT